MTAREEPQTQSLELAREELRPDRGDPMSTLTEQIAEAFEPHIFDKPVALCRCGVEMNLTGHRMREHREHLATVTAAVVAGWLESDAIINLAATHSSEFTGSGSAGVVVAEAIAAEARKGADQ